MLAVMWDGAMWPCMVIAGFSPLSCSVLSLRLAVDSVVWINKFVVFFKWSLAALVFGGEFLCSRTVANQEKSVICYICTASFLISAETAQPQGLRLKKSHHWVHFAAVLQLLIISHESLLPTFWNFQSRLLRQHAQEIFKMYSEKWKFEHLQFWDKLGKLLSW